MKRVGNLFPRILQRGNLRLAVTKALRGKRQRRDAQRFVSDLEGNLSRLQNELSAGNVHVGNCQQFIIWDPKQRTITAPCFRERVLHHAIMNVCEPIFERWLVADTYACRVDKGRLACVDRARGFARRYHYFLKMDVRRYFDSISHDILLRQLCRRFKDADLLQLLQRIIESYRVAPGRGLPIGALTSQHLANFYLGTLDRFVKEDRAIRGYVRYMDDFVVWADSIGALKTVQEEIIEVLDDGLSLCPKHNSILNRTDFGMDFLGLRVFRDHLRLARRSKVRYARKVKCLEALFEEGEIAESDLQRRVGSMTAFIMTQGVCSWRFRQTVLERSTVGGPRP